MATQYTTPTTIVTSTAPKTTATAVSSTTSTTKTLGHWWDSLGIPQYGGTMTVRVNANITGFDPYMGQLMSINCAWMERLSADDWTLDPAVFDFTLTWRPPDYVKGSLAESWEFPDPSTFVLHIRKGVRWQDIPPASGREFIADDVVYHFNRMYGLGGGFPGSPYYAGVTTYKDLISLTAPDKYTAVFKWKTPNPEVIMETLQAGGGDLLLENPEAVKMWGDVNDWHHAIGTGPFILKDFVSGSAATLVSNPNYWGYDERYPQNKLPYIDTLKVLIIPDQATALAALRTGKVDVMDGISLQDTQSMQKTNPEILTTMGPIYQKTTVDPRIDVKPFTDIRVRQAMQMALDLPTIAKSYYGGTAQPYPLALTSYYETGWGLPYDQWPQDLKDEYAYNPTAAKKLLADAGYPSGFKTNIVADGAGDMDLLQVVKSYFAAVGIDMEIRPMDSASWLAFVQQGHKHDQIAFRVSGSLGLTYEPIRQLYRFQVGYVLNFEMINDPVFNAFQTNAMAATSVDAMKKVVKDANLYVARQHFAISLVQPNSFALCQPWLKGFNDQYGAVSGTGTGPAYLGFYAARYWVDQNMKKSLGH
jgi:peptide/nickel transport system substrate-binding protein